MKQTKQLQQNLIVDDICLMKYTLRDERKSLLITILEIDEFSDYHPVKLVCKVDADELSEIETGVSVSLVSKNPDSLLYVLLKGTVFQKSVHDGQVTLSITDVQYFTRENENNISSFKKIKKLSVLPAA